MQPTLLFDADGVLITSEFFSDTLAREFKITPEMTQEFFTTAFTECIEGRIDLKKTITPHLKQWGWKGSTQDFLHYWLSSGSSVDTQLITLIQQLRKKGFKCFIATNQEKHRTNYIKEDMGFSALFDGVISSSDLGYKKPSIEFYRQLTQKIGITELKNTWFFDDTEANVISAKKFGLQARLYTGLAEFEGFAKKQNWV